MEITVTHLSGMKFEASTRGHKIVCDQPAGGQGTDAGMTPPEFLLASLGTCVGYYAAEYLRARSLPMDGLKVRVWAEKVQGPARLDGFRIEIEAPDLADEKHRAGVLRAAKSCLIHSTLANPPAIEFALRTQAAARA